MKKLVILGLVSLLLVPLFLVGCGGGGVEQTIALTLDDFRAQKVIHKTVDIGAGDSFAVKLETNPSTGYSWGDAVIEKTSIITQTSYEYIKPTATGMVGAPGNDVWVFSGKAVGTSNIYFSYGQAWEGGEKDAFSLLVEVTVK